MPQISLPQILFLAMLSLAAFASLPAPAIAAPAPAPTAKTSAPSDTEEIQWRGRFKGVIPPQWEAIASDFGDREPSQVWLFSPKDPKTQNLQIALIFIEMPALADVTEKFDAPQMLDAYSRSFFFKQGLALKEVEPWPCGMSAKTLFIPRGLSAELKGPRVTGQLRSCVVLDPTRGSMLIGLLWSVDGPLGDGEEVFEEMLLKSSLRIKRSKTPSMDPSKDPGK